MSIAIAELGISIKEYWSMTPREFVNAVEHKRDLERVKMNTTTWLTAALQRAKRLPPLKQLLMDHRPKILAPEEKVKRLAEHQAIVVEMGHGS